MVLDEAYERLITVGEAHPKTCDENGLAVWELAIGGQPIEGRWVIIDREFRPVP